MKINLLLAILSLTAGPALAQPPSAGAPPLASDEAIEQFLLHAEVGKSHSAGKGVTDSQRVTMRDGTRTHDAHVQTIDDQMKEGPGGQARIEFNFRDSWMYNVAAYRLDRLIGLNLVPVAVERRWHTQSAAFSWWVDDVMMDEATRLAKKIQPPDVESWNQEMQLVRLFDQLIYNVDRNVGNLLITKDWRMWAIDHTRAFRVYRQLKTPRDVTRCDRGVLERLRKLDKPTLTARLGHYLTGFEIDALLARRDAIVALIDQAGPAALFDRRAISSTSTTPQ